MAHLNRDSTACLEWYQHHVEQMSSMQIQALDAEVARLKREARRRGVDYKHAELPCTAWCG
eukprot:11853872-Alexandrium_andersonii.AAC.1